MRIVTFDFAGHAPAVELSRALAIRGHDVLHLYSADVQTPKWDLTRRPDDPATFTIEPLRLGTPPPEHRAVARLLFWRRSGRTVARIAREFRPQVLLATSSTLFLHRSLQTAFADGQVQFVYWMQRFYSSHYDQTLRARGRLAEAFLGGWVRDVENKLLWSSDVIVVPAEYLLAMLDEGWGIGARQCMVVRNWAPLDGVDPRERANAWAKTHNITAPCVVMHTGHLDAERCDLLARIAAALRGREDILLVTVSDAPSAARLAQDAAARGLPNLRALPFQDYAAYPDVLASADLLLCLVQPEEGVLAIPGKLPFYLCAGRAVVVAAPPENLAADIVRESGAGVVVPPGEVDAICAAIGNLADNAAQRATAQACARAYAEHNFTIGKITDRFERLFERITTGPARKRPGSSTASASRAFDLSSPDRSSSPHTKLSAHS